MMHLRSCLGSLLYSSLGAGLESNAFQSPLFSSPSVHLQGKRRGGKQKYIEGLIRVRHCVSHWVWWKEKIKQVLCPPGAHRLVEEDESEQMHEILTQTG